jgi:hypothetical protein
MGIWEKLWGEGEAVAPTPTLRKTPTTPTTPPAQTRVVESVVQEPKRAPQESSKPAPPPVEAEVEKTCRHCETTFRGEKKISQNFRENKNARDGLFLICNKCLDKARTDKRAGFSHGQPIELAPPSPLENRLRLYLEKEKIDPLATLPGEDRDLIALELKCSASAVGVALANLRRRLAKRLDWKELRKGTDADTQVTTPAVETPLVAEAPKPPVKKEPQAPRRYGRGATKDPSGQTISEKIARLLDSKGIELDKPLPPGTYEWLCKELGTGTGSVSALVSQMRRKLKIAPPTREQYTQSWKNYPRGKRNQETYPDQHEATEPPPPQVEAKATEIPPLPTPERLEQRADNLVEKTVNIRPDSIAHLLLKAALRMDQMERELKDLKDRLG